jgi:long-chain fatty acid transport protein
LSRAARRPCRGALLFLGLGLSSVPAYANPLDAFGFGSRGAAMAGATSADSHGVWANYENPAGLAHARSLELAVGYFRADHALDLDRKDARIDPVKGVVFGFVLPGTVFGVPVAVGLGAHVPDDRLSRVRAHAEDEPRWELYDNRNQRLFLAAHAAVRPIPWLALGVGYATMADTKGSIAVTGLANIFSPDDSQLRHEVDAELAAVRYPQAGARVDLGPDVSLGLVYRGEYRMQLDLAAHLAGSLSEITTARYDLATRSVNAFVPAQAALGASWHAFTRVRANLDLAFVRWSAYVPPVAVVTADVSVPPPPGGFPAGIRPPSAPVTAPVTPIDMKDRLVPRLGVEVLAMTGPRVDVLVRAGYAFERSPIPPQTGATNYVDADRHVVAGGAGLRLRVGDGAPELPRELRLDAHAALSAFPRITVAKDNPADLVGDYTAGGHIVTWGFSAEVAF